MFRVASMLPTGVDSDEVAGIHATVVVDEVADPDRMMELLITLLVPGVAAEVDHTTKTDVTLDHHEEEEVVGSST